MLIDLFADPKLLQNPTEKIIVLLGHEMIVIKKLLHNLDKNSGTLGLKLHLDNKQLEVLKLIASRLDHNGRALDTFSPPELKQKILPLAAYLLTFSPRIHTEQDKNFIRRNPKLLYFLWQKIPQDGSPFYEKYGKRADQSALKTPVNTPGPAKHIEPVQKHLPASEENRQPLSPAFTEQTEKKKPKPFFWIFFFLSLIIFFICYFLFTTANITALNFAPSRSSQLMHSLKEASDPVQKNYSTSKIETVAGLYFKEQAINFQNKLALTLDDIEVTTDIDALLSILQKYKIKAVFFIEASVLVDRNDQPHPEAQELLHKILFYGHTIGNHSFGHPNFSKLAQPLDIAMNLQKAEAIIDKVLGFHYNITYVRPPYGNRGKDNSVDLILKQMNKLLILWEIDSQDWQMNLGYNDNRHLSAQEIITKTLSKIKNSNGGVILLHGFQHLTSVLEPIIKETLALSNAQGSFSFVPLEELLAIKYGQR